MPLGVEFIAKSSFVLFLGERKRERFDYLLENSRDKPQFRAVTDKMYLK
ncbi:hypothetical protein GXM_01153 [Nostoc sphaeroides CCNUC1]|uniref:Uncharacterized protein n=1 Tax=Nostoc sphaeroides CCNUC1 TaxID=2653204 RepID=A0A5P8VTI0_9NOSO|nr:hypothetical protein GXM_01153 [Nostoc sphaeroides CCNUC1]